MIRTIVTFALFLLNLVASAQSQKLYLFVTADSLKQGVRNQEGAVVIPADHPVIGYWSADELIADSIIDFYGMPHGEQPDFDSLRPAYTANTTFDRSGKVLYHPFFFDNGADYIQEGTRRYVDRKTGKMGLVHPYGKVLIPALYDFISPLHDGYLMAYNGVQRQTEAGGEHWCIVPDPKKKYEAFVLNKEGKKVKGRMKSSQDVTLQLAPDSLYYPAFYRAVDVKEEKLLARVQQDPDVQRLFAGAATDAPYYILERPTAAFPYYIIGHSQQYSFSYVAVDEHGARYHFDYYKPMMPLKAYLKSIQ